MILPPGAINTGDPVEPRPSATVLLIRGSRPFELLLVRRPGGADFAPGAYVFPGGTVHADDRGADDEIKAAAIRELFEEAGILLARPLALDLNPAAVYKSAFQTHFNAAVVYKP